MTPRRRLAFKQPEPNTQGSHCLGLGSLSIRRSTPYDVEALQGLHLCQLNLAEAHHLIYCEQLPELGPDEWYERLHCGNLSEWLQKGVEILHARAGGQVIGYISFWPPRRDEQQRDPRRREELDPSATINHIIVKDGYRGFGVGKQLMDALAHYLDSFFSPSFRSTCQLRLAIASANVLALEWYCSQGFYEEGRLREPLTIGSGKAKPSGPGGPQQGPPVAELLWIRLTGKPSGGMAKPVLPEPLERAPAVRSASPRSPATPATPAPTTQLTSPMLQAVRALQPPPLETQPAVSLPPRKRKSSDEPAADARDKWRCCPTSTVLNAGEDTDDAAALPAGNQEGVDVD